MSRLNEIHCRALAAQLGCIVRGVLWPRYEGRIRDRAGDLDLTTRVGRGNATYHRADRQGGHLIVFGWKMVQQKSAGWAAASRWTSGREMATRPYFEGRIDLLRVLAHAACHEFAHLIQTVEGGRRRGSVHNAAFYRVLDEMHRTGVADEVHGALLRECRAAGIDARWSEGPEVAGAPAAPDTSRWWQRGASGAAEHAAGRGTTPASSRGRAAVALRSADRGAPAGGGVELRPGDAVCFVARGERITGRVRRVNRRTVSIVPDRPRSPGQYWRVAPTSVDRI